jgi:imidazolonepropionase-like amidohydrolase
MIRRATAGQPSKLTGGPARCKNAAWSGLDGTLDLFPPPDRNPTTLKPSPHLLIAVLGFTVTLRAEENAVAFVGARILPVKGDPIERGVLVIRGGKIAAVGPADGTAVPEGARRIDAVGKVIIPGLVDTHSHIGGIGGADGSAPLQPDVRILDSINVRDAGFRRAVAGGLTTLNIMPGSGHLLSGRTIYVKLRGGSTIEDLFIRDAEGKPMGGVKMANGTNSRRAPPFPETRGKSAALVRAAFIKAAEYRDKIARAAGDPEKMPPRDLGLETLVEVLERKVIVHHHTHRHDDIVTVLRLVKEFNFRVVLHHVSDGWKVAGEIAAAGVPCSIILVDSPGGKLEAADIALETGAVLEKAGVLTAFHTDDWITDSRLFLRSPALAVRAGMSREGALRAVTLAGAAMLDLEARVGSLEPGKDADFVLLGGDPFSVYTKVLETWVEGKKVFDRSDPEDLLHAVGGHGAGRDQRPYFCCFEGEEAPE